MSTLTEQITRLMKCITLGDAPGHKMFIPPQVLEVTQGLFFFKKVGHGASIKGCAGVFMKRLSKTEWSRPVVVEFSQGDLYWSKSHFEKSAKTDIMLLISNQMIIQQFEETGTFVFDDRYVKLKKGMCVQKQIGVMARLESWLKNDPSRLQPNDNFSYGFHRGKLFPCHIDNPGVAIRDSSNMKFYSTSAARLPRKIFNEVKLRDKTKLDFVQAVKNVVSRYFDVDHRFPDYQRMDHEEKQSEEYVNDENDANDDNKIRISQKWRQNACSDAHLSRLWSDSNCSQASHDSSMMGSSSRLYSTDSVDSTLLFMQPENVPRERSISFELP